MTGQHDVILPSCLLDNVSWSMPGLSVFSKPSEGFENSDWPYKCSKRPQSQ